MQNVLILDANQRSALAATRSLGKRQVPVMVADTTPRTLAGCSRYCQATFVYPSPYQSPGGFLEVVQREAGRRGVQILFPMSELSSQLVLQHRDQFPGVRIPFASFDAYEALSHKGKLTELATALGLPVPVSFPIRSWDDIVAAVKELAFPVVLKPHRSRIWVHGKWMEAAVAYARSMRDLEQIVSTCKWFREYPFLMQQYIPGHG